MTAYYTTDGPKSGPCGHRHKTVNSARACVDRAGKEAIKLNPTRGFVDRSVYLVRTDGTRERLEEDESVLLGRPKVY